MRHTRTFRFRASLALAIILAASAAIASPAQATHPTTRPTYPTSTHGLYGSADGTYDGVFRQSLAILGLIATGVKPDPIAVKWLKDQQCADGSFQAIRTDLAVACGPSDPDNFTGPDTNSTALAAEALALSGYTSRANRAFTWLNGNQLSNGGWPFYAGGSADANSTGIIMSALNSSPNGAFSSPVAKGRAYLNAISLPCGMGNGALPYQVDGPANLSASAQGLLGLGGYQAGMTRRSLAADPACSGAAVNRVSSYLIGKMDPNGLIPPAIGTEPDYTSTACMLLGLVARGFGKSAVIKATNGLAHSATAYTTKSGVSQPGPLGLLLLVAKATGVNPRDFGGVNLGSMLQKSLS